jgi:glycosyltransferase involved in cell wall biosynthesis
LELKTPLVSVIITAYNRPVYLKDTLESIYAQTFKNFEVLVIDDGSSKENAKQNQIVVNQFLDFYYYYKSNTGQPDSRNYGIKKSKGKLIAFCDDDDIWVKEKLEIQVDILNKNIDYDMTTGCIGYIDEKTNIIKNKIKCHKGFNHGYVFDHFLIKNRTSSVTPMLRRVVFDEVGFFDTSYLLAEDWEFWRRLSYLSKFYYYDGVLAYVREHDFKMSKTESQDISEKIFLFYRLSRSLEYWGKNKFDGAVLKKINNSEKYFYRRLISNHLNHRKKAHFFFINLLKRPFKFIHILLIYLSSVLIFNEKS